MSNPDNIQAQAPSGSARRAFLQTSSVASGLLLLKPSTAFGSRANSAVEIGIVGCGNRGVWIGGLFAEFTTARIVALGDLMPDRLEAARLKLRAGPARLYRGSNACREMAHSRLDGVVIETPDYFHPQHAAEAIDAGRHVFLPKPVAVDVPGCLSVLESGRKAAAANLTLLVDFQSRVRPVFQEAAARVRGGEIGRPVMGHVYYHGPTVAPRTRPGASADENRVRNWYFDKILSGDIIVSQDVHVIDMANWFLQAHPVRAYGAGGRLARLELGDCWDHFLVHYWYPGEVKVDFSGNQFVKGFQDLCSRIYGTGGTLDAHYGGAVEITGDRPWKGAEKDPTFKDGAVTNVKEFVAAIEKGQPLNNVPASVESTLTAILGRTAAYRQTMVTWDQMMRENEKLDAKLDLNL